jgi:hypothetical protein
MSWLRTRFAASPLQLFSMFSASNKKYQYFRSRFVFLTTLFSFQKQATFHNVCHPQEQLFSTSFLEPASQQDLL